MGTEDQIAVRLQQGATRKQLIGEGFRKSTVYKVAELVRSQFQAPTPNPLVFVQLATDRERYLPGTTAQTTFTLTNQSSADLYIFPAGIRPEWLPPSEWIPTTIRKLLGAGATTVIRIGLPVPPATTLGEKDLFFGIQGQWVGPQATSPSTEVMWTNPMILNVQRSLIGATVFLAHSVLDVSLVSQLESTLDDNGVSTTVGDANLVGPQRSAIDAADFFVAIITHPWRLAAVADEIRHAQSRGKDLILLRDAALAVMTPTHLAGLPWVDLNFATDTASILFSLFSKLNDSIARRDAAKKKEQSDAVAIILMGLGALAAGVALARGKPPAV